MNRLCSALGAALLVLSCAGPESPIDGEEIEAIPRAGIFTNGIFTNGIFTNGIFTNGIGTNSMAAEVIINKGLDDAVLDPIIQTNLEDPATQQFMRYLVSCALRPSQIVTWTSAFNPAVSQNYRGDVGLCPEWEVNPPTKECRQRVSACLLARNNAFGVSVAISLRGHRDDVNPIPLAPRTMPWPFKWRTSTQVDSSKACAFPTVGLARNCGWRGAGVGVCTPGTPVTISTGCSLDSGDGNTMLRVCRRVHFCDSGSPELLAANDNGCGYKPKVSFICPPDGTYAVLRANFRSWLPAAMTPVASSGELPAPEPAVFAWREGGFYGDIFEAISNEKRQVRINPIKGNLQEQIRPGTDKAAFEESNWRDEVRETLAFRGVIYPKMFACSSKEWNAQDAYFQLRVCAGPTGENCAAKYVGPCFPESCGSDNAHPSSFDYKDCKDGSPEPPWSQPITTFLNQPCDLVGLKGDEEGRVCSTVGRTPIDPPRQ